VRFDARVGAAQLVWFGAVNLVAVIVLARLCANGFASLWCFYAALASGAIALHLRFAKARKYQSRSSQRGVALPVEFVRRAIRGRIEYMTEFRVAPLRRSPGPPASCAGPFEASADSFDRSTRALVALVGFEIEPSHTPHVEGVGHHEQLRLGIGGRSLAVAARNVPPISAASGNSRAKNHRNVRNLVMPMISDVSLRRVAKGTAQRDRARRAVDEPRPPCPHSCRARSTTRTLSGRPTPREPVPGRLRARAASA